MVNWLWLAIGGLTVLLTLLCAGAGLISRRQAQVCLAIGTGGGLLLGFVQPIIDTALV